MPLRKKTTPSRLPRSRKISNVLSLAWQKSDFSVGTRMASLFFFLQRTKGSALAKAFLALWMDG